MRIGQYYSHLNGYEYMLVHKRQLWDEICSAINNVDASLAFTKVSKEKNRVGELLYSPSNMNHLFKKEFIKSGWEERRINYYVNSDIKTTQEIVNIQDAEKQRNIIESNGYRAYRTYNQVDFVKEGVAIEVQFGKYFSVQYDLHVKHTFFYGRGDIDVGIEIIPMHSLMSNMSSGVAWYENELTNILREGRSNPSVPIVLIGIEP